MTNSAYRRVKQSYDNILYDYTTQYKNAAETNKIIRMSFQFFENTIQNVVAENYFECKN